MLLTDAELHTLKQLLAEATERPWRQDEHYPDLFIWGPNGEMVADHDSEGRIRMRGVGAQLPIASNAALIVAAVNALEPLVDEICERRAKSAEARG